MKNRWGVDGLIEGSFERICDGFTDATTDYEYF